MDGGQGADGLDANQASQASGCEYDMGLTGMNADVEVHAYIHTRMHGTCLGCRGCCTEGSGMPMQTLHMTLVQHHALCTVPAAVLATQSY